MTDRHELTLTRDLKAPPALVFSLWGNVEHFDQWFRPKDFTSLESRLDFTEGGAWFTHFRSPKGNEYKMGGTYQKIEPGRLLVFTQAWENEDGAPELETVITVTFEEISGGQTRLTFHHAGLATAESAEDHAQGWGEMLDYLEVHVEREGRAA